MVLSLAYTGMRHHFCFAVKTLVEMPRDVADATSTTSEPLVVTPGPPGPPPHETAELGVTDIAPPAVCRAHAKASLATSFDAVDHFQRMSGPESARRSSSLVKKSGLLSTALTMHAADVRQTILPRKPKRYVNGARIVAA